MRKNNLLKKTALENASKRLNDSLVRIGVFTMTVFLVSLGPVFAVGGGDGLWDGGSGDNFFDSLGSSFNSMYLGLVALSPVVAGLAFVIAKVWQILTPEKQGRAEPREWARNALFNYFLIIAAVGIINFIGRIAGSIK